MACHPFLLSLLQGPINPPGPKRKRGGSPRIVLVLLHFMSSVSMEELKCLTQYHSKLITVEVFVFLWHRREACRWEAVELAPSVLCWFFLSHLAPHLQASEPLVHIQGRGERGDTGLDTARPYEPNFPLYFLLQQSLGRSSSSRSNFLFFAFCPRASLLSFCRVLEESLSLSGECLGEDNPLGNS